VETTTAALYMAYLASAIGTAQGMTPVTDMRAPIGSLVGRHGTLLERLAELRYQTVTGILPAPAGPVPVAELREFKDRRDEDLRRCRTHLDAKLVALARAESQEELEILRHDLWEEIEDELKRIASEMNRRRWPLALAGVGAVLSTGVAVGDALLQGANPLVAGLIVGATMASQVPGVSAAALAAREAGKLPKSPLAYAFEVGALGTPQGPDPTLW
jgi:hypothetical protein